MRVMIHLSMTLGGLSVMGGIMSWDVGSVILIYRDSVFFENLVVSS
jgi:hypothetical protein